jgi:hypothetical protein
MWFGFIGLRTETNSRVHKILGISWIAKQLLAYQEDRSHMELGALNTRYIEKCHK